MQASELDEKYAGEFPDSTKISAGDSLKDIVKVEEFFTKDKNRGASLTDINGNVYHTTTKQPVSFILSPKLNLQALIDKAQTKNKGVDLFFYNTKPDQKYSSRDSMLNCSLYPQ